MAILKLKSKYDDEKQENKSLLQQLETTSQEYI